MGATASYFLRLPDGNLRGEGFPATAQRSLARVAAASGPPLSPLEGSGSYPDMNAVVAVVAAVLRIEAAAARATDAEVRLHATDPDTAFNPRDHSDHRATGRAAVVLAQANGWTLVQYAGYSTARWPTNLNAERFVQKAGLFMAYDRARVLADPTWSAYAEAPVPYSAWLSRTYVRPSDFSGHSP